MKKEIREFSDLKILATLKKLIYTKSGHYLVVSLDNLTKVGDSIILYNQDKSLYLETKVERITFDKSGLTSAAFKDHIIIDGNELLPPHIDIDEYIEKSHVIICNRVKEYLFKM